MNKEPVGVVIEVEETYGHTFKKRKSKVVQWSVDVDIGTPLYTTPQIKELSGDEIHEVAKKFLTSYDLEIDQGLYGDTSRVLIAIEDWYGFARAILKKASEK